LKPRKQRKKTKPSALTRPPKKGKKKKKVQQKMFHVISSISTQPEAGTFSFVIKTLPASISANVDGPRDAVSRKIDHIALPTEDEKCRL